MHLLKVTKLYPSSSRRTCIIAVHDKPPPNKRWQHCHTQGCHAVLPTNSFCVTLLFSEPRNVCLCKSVSCGKGREWGVGENPGKLRLAKDRAVQPFSPGFPVLVGVLRQMMFVLIPTKPERLQELQNCVGLGPRTVVMVRFVCEISIG